MSESHQAFAIPPGETIKEQLENHHMSRKEFSARMKMSEKSINKLINGDSLITQEVALCLEVVLGVPASFWTRLEKMYREKLLKVHGEG